MGCQKPQRACAQGVQAPCTLDVMLSRRPFLLRALPIGLCLMVWACTGLAAAPVAHEVLDRADSLRHEGKLVQALSSYRTLLTEPVTGCEHARIHMGTAAVQWHAGNVSEAHPHLREVQTSCNTCPPHVRTPLALELAELLVRCGSTAEALDVLIRESDLHPSPEHAAEVQLALIELHFAEGHWAQVWNDASELAGPRAEGLRLQAGAMLGQPLAELPVDTYLKSARPSNHAEVVSELTHLHTLLTGAGRATEALALAQRMGTLYDPLADPEPWTVAQLRIAVSAEQAGQPLDALLAFHEAGLVATQLDDMPLRARIAREQARFEEKRGATQAALQHLAMADSLTLAMLQSAHQRREPRSFQAHPIMPADPFELAAAEAMKPAVGPGAWPFACALILLGLLAAALRANELKKALRKERVRAFRMQRMIHTEADPFVREERVFSDLGVAENGQVEELLTRPDRLDFDDVIASLEMDHGTAVEWEFNSTKEGQNAPEGLLSLLSVTIKRLLDGQSEPRTFAGRIRNDWHGIHVEIEGPETSSTRELQRMFAGGTHSSTWNPVLVQIEKLAGRFTVEKRSSGDLALTFMLPHTGETG